MKSIMKGDSAERAIFEKWKIDSKIAENTSDKLWDLFDKPITETGETINPKQSLQQALLKEQGHICCYCGKRIGEKNVVIEHFFPKSQSRDCTFNYNNVHASCEGGGSLEFIIRSEHKEIRHIVSECNISESDLIALNPKLKALSKGKKFGEIYSKGSKIIIQKQPFSCDNLKGNDANNPKYFKDGIKKDKNGDNTPISSPFILSPLDISIDERFRYEDKGNILPVVDTDLVAKDTITLLALNNDKLCKERSKTLKAVRDSFNEIFETFPENELLVWLKSEIEDLYDIEKNKELEEYCFVKMWFYRSNFP